jgi:hypothetical protein
MNHQITSLVVQDLAPGCGDDDIAIIFPFLNQLTIRIVRFPGIRTISYIIRNSETFSVSVLDVC